MDWISPACFKFQNMGLTLVMTAGWLKQYVEAIELQFVGRDDLETFIVLCFYVLFHDDARPFSDLPLIN